MSAAEILCDALQRRGAEWWGLLSRDDGATWKWEPLPEATVERLASAYGLSLSDVASV